MYFKFLLVLLFKKIKEIQDQCEIEKEELRNSKKINQPDAFETTKLTEEISQLKAQILIYTENEAINVTKDDTIQILNRDLNEKGIY